MASRRHPRPEEIGSCPVPPSEHDANRRRRGGGGAPVSPCSLLHEDLVERIAERVLAGDLLDYVRFRAVCKNWRSCTVDPRGRCAADPRFHPHRWTMLPPDAYLEQGARAPFPELEHLDTVAFQGFRKVDPGRVKGTEQKRQQRMEFLAWVMQSPEFLKHEIFQNETRNELQKSVEFLADGILIDLENQLR
ncbi:hypothetical protein HU200_028266 [Digitaria exilis]|uniref:F-box domain-containing protein n=1 Tax=Digitaria exilis TaxID=1010633 RepID=A0A835BW16_9POAL|nr:hypothetical protein HU200_028266 [Digitaria exilis]